MQEMLTSHPADGQPGDVCRHIRGVKVGAEDLYVAADRDVGTTSVEGNFEFSMRIRRTHAEPAMPLRGYTRRCVHWDTGCCLQWEGVEAPPAASIDQRPPKSARQ